MPTHIWSQINVNEVSSADISPPSQIFWCLSLFLFSAVPRTHLLALFGLQKSDSSIMFMTRFIGRTLLAAAKSETHAASAAAATATSGHNPLEEFFEADRSQDEDKPIVYGMI
jgi:hypothetical protein